MIRKVLDFLSIVFRGGTSHYNEGEMKLLLYALDALPNNEKEIFRAQINGIRLIQRQHPGRLVVSYYRKPKAIPQLPYLGMQHCLVKITYISKGKRKTTSLVLHDGRFMTFERNVPSKAAEIESLVKVLLHPSGYSSVAEEIDSEEHGGRT